MHVLVLCSHIEQLTVDAVKPLNYHVLELFFNYMTILTASMGTPLEQYRSRKRRMPYHLNNNGQGSEGCLIPCSTGMDSNHVLAKCVLLDNIETNSGHVHTVYRNDGLQFVYIPLFVRGSE